MNFLKSFTTVFVFFLASTCYSQSKQEKDFNKGVGLLKERKYKEAIKEFSAVIPNVENKELKNFVISIGHFPITDSLTLKTQYLILILQLSLIPMISLPILTGGKHWGI